MTLLVMLWSYGILKVVDPTPNEPLYVFYDGECELQSGTISVDVMDPTPPEASDPIGTLTQGELECNLEELVYPGI
ncbi:MAG: hypothetical protein ACRD21_19315 [Vicinamibacteria bacterium]